ncbi:hypothetical protein [Chitinophaga japonensis]|uniref:Lipoprotein n=1 Tax=Chitinophaga japonensis TaxID=104662 RepID=A0A562SSR4_CHIJA|nr:hypothetical protein [Chitinophaga japonensis]TWI84252.1 hypothetical protein LX66_4616 [Chitinophaga japonensis]
MIHASKKLVLLALGGIGLLAAWACNNNRNAGENDTTLLDAAPPADSAAMATGSDFNQTVTFKQYSFVVNAKGEDTLRRLVITGNDSASSFAEVNTPMEGSIYYCEAADLDNDGQPEVYCFARGADSADFTKVYAYAIDQQGNLPISFPELTSEDAENYMGHDSLYIEKGYVVRSFPIGMAEAGDTVPRKTIRYTLKRGPSAYRLEQVE